MTDDGSGTWSRSFKEEKRSGVLKKDIDGNQGEMKEHKTKKLT